MTADTQDMIAKALKFLTDDEAQQLLDYIAFLQWQRKRVMPAGARYDFRDLAELRAADIFQPDLAICGGTSEAMRIGAIASAWNLRLAPHLWTGALAFAAGMHVAAASPSGWILEYSLGANPMLHDLSKESFTVIEGMLEIPDRPGLNVTIHQDFVDRSAVA